MRTSGLLALAAAFSTSAAVLQGFNYGATFTDGSAKAQSDFQAEFSTAKGLVGTSGFTAARLYTMIQAGTADSTTAAIPAAIAEGTQLLLGLWASGGQGDFTNELSALSSAIHNYGSSFTSLVAGISVGSEDLYRISPTGIAAMSGAGADPATLTGFISQLRQAIAGTGLSGAAVGHVDTWTAWVNGSNDAVIAACDFIGMDAYPYFQNTMANSIEAGNETFWEAYYNTTAAVGSKPVWITETGWPVSGPTENLAVPSIPNAQTYWDQVGCTAFGQINTFWYTLQDAAPTTPSPSFGIVGSTLTTQPLYNLTCPAKGAVVSSSSSSSASPSTTATSASSASSIASSVGASAIKSAESGLTSIGGSGPIVITAESSSVGQLTSVAGSGTTASPIATSVFYTTKEVSVTSCGSSVGNCPVTTSMTTYAVATSAVVVIPASGSSAPGASSVAAPSFITTFAPIGTSPVGPAPTGGNGTLATGSTGAAGSPSAPSAPLSTFTGGAAVATGSLGGVLGVVLAIAAAL
ncbi:hypothetical protein MMC19_001951 [Ptychographa xylographoides]|nr:hypothetical protein [Ptychographa xylographoides]